MKHFSSARTGGFLLAVILILALTLIIAGTAISSPNSEWVVFTGVALFFLAGVPAVGRLNGGPSADRKKISTGLVTLSSAAILAVYAAGYDRTGTAANRFEEQASMPRRRAAPVAAAVVRPSEPPAVNTAPAAPIPDGSENVISPPVAPVSPVSSSAQPVTPVETAASIAAVAQPADLSASNSVTVAPAPAAPVAPVIAAKKEVKWEYNDGGYWGWGSCRHGDLQVYVTIEAGIISSAEISKCETRYPCSMIKEIPPQVVTRQDPDKIDNVSGATQSVDAYYEAVIDALNKAVK